MSSTRVTDALIMQLDEINAIRRSVEGATVNDVIVAIVGGGLRKYLQSKDELPATTLSCTAPINMRSERNSASSGLFRAAAVAWPIAVFQGGLLTYLYTH